MAESSSHNPSSPKITHKEELVTLDKPESPNPFLPIDQIEFIFEDIAFTTNNEGLTQYKEYLSEFWYIAKTLDDTKIWVSTPTGGIRGDIDYAKLIWEDIIHKLSKKSREKVVSYPRFISLLLKYMMPEYDNKELTINPTQMFMWTPKLQNLPHKLRRFPKAKSLELKVDLEENNLQNIHLSPRLRQIKSKTGQSEKETQSSSAKDKSPSHPLPPTLVVGEMHKEAQQASGGPTSLGATNEEGVHPQISSGINEESRADDISKKIKLEDLPDLLKDTRSAFFTPDSPQDEPIIVSNKSEEEEEVAKDRDTHASSHESQKDELEQQKAKAEAEFASLKASPSYPDINQLTDLLVTSLKPEFSKLLASHDFASCLLNALKELPSKFTELSREIKELKKHVQDMEIELCGDLKEIPTKQETFTSTISRKAQDFGFPSKSIKQATTSPAEGEKHTNPATMNVEPNLHDELVDLLGIDIVTQYYNKKLLYDKYCDKMLKIRKSSKIINCDVLTQKGPITLQVYREDGTVEVISNVKVSDLHLAKWKEVYKAGKRLLYVKRNKAISLEKIASKNMGDDVNINTLPMEQYLALIQDNIRPGIVKPEIDGDVEFEINGHFMRDLRCKLFKGTDDEDAHKHMRRVLENVDLFHFLGVTHDAVMLRVFPNALTGPTLRWKNRISAGLITTWSLLEKVFIRLYCLPFKTAVKFEKMYRVENIPTCIRLDSKGFIPLMSPTQAFKSIQVMADHSYNYYDGETTRESINDSSDNIDIQNLKKEDKAVEQSKYIRSLEETIIKFCEESIKK
ncbi:hypothetical protein Tco_0796059 [Tanacetum coccineum]